VPMHSKTWSAAYYKRDRSFSYPSFASMIRLSDARLWSHPRALVHCRCEQPTRDQNVLRRTYIDIVSVDLAVSASVSGHLDLESGRAGAQLGVREAAVKMKQGRCCRKPTIDMTMTGHVMADS
jgi:hypothetical protein